MVDDKLITTVQTTFSLYGLVLSRNLGAALAQQLININEDERDNWLTQITECILAQQLEDPHIKIDNIKLAIKEVMRADTLRDTETILNVINVFDVPKIRYDLPKKKFVLETVAPDLYPEAAYKSLLFQTRFDLLWFRTLRHELFTPPKLGESSKDKIELTPIEYLLSETKTGDVCTMGLLSQLSENQFYLEDTGGSVKIDLKNASFQNGIITEGSIVIVNGNYDDDILQVEEIGLPPVELASNSRADFGDLNTFGGSSKVLLKKSDRLKHHEDNNMDERIIFLSELWLDNSIVLKKFKILLDGFSEFPPVAFVICGHFLSFPTNVSSISKMKEGFKDLATIIEDYPNIRQTSKFIFVPGPDDLGSPKILPRQPIPTDIAEDIAKTIPNVVFATNPCRIQYCTKEIVVLRENILSKMCRNALHFPQSGEIFDHYARTIISQSHLTPLTLPVVPVSWKFDHALQIYPIPDLIVVADQFPPYITKYSDCHVINPGMFPKNNFSFHVYVPSSNVIEDCEIPNTSEDS